MVRGSVVPCHISIIAFPYKCSSRHHHCSYLCQSSSTKLCHIIITRVWNDSCKTPYCYFHKKLSSSSITETTETHHILACHPVINPIILGVCILCHKRLLSAAVHPPIDVLLGVRLFPVQQYEPSFLQIQQRFFLRRSNCLTSTYRKRKNITFSHESNKKPYLLEFRIPPKESME